MKIPEMEKELANFIKIWFIAHIIYEDKKISQWMNKNEIPEFTFCWKNSFKIGNTHIDAEHQELFKIASEAFKKVPANEKKAKIKETLKKLFDYFKEHFKNEEEFMISIKYEKIEEHKAIHVNIIDILKKLILDSTNMESKEIEDNLANFIEISLVHHIVNEDKKISHWVQYLDDLEKSKDFKDINELKDIN